MSLTPAVFLSAGVAGASTALMLSHMQPAKRPAISADGHLAEQEQPSAKLLSQAARLPRTGAGPAIAVPDGPQGIPEPMLAAYQDAADQLAETQPDCGLHWSVLASIGRIESDHARAGQIDVEGTTVSAILGPRLSGGPGIAAIKDTDGGELDGDPVWDRAIGSMQFIPSTWQRHGADGNDDGVATPHNVHDANVAAGKYLCSGGVDLRNPQELAKAVFQYNQSDDYVRTVLAWAAAYARGVTPTPTEVAPMDEEEDVLAGQRLPEEPAVIDVPEPPAQLEVPPELSGTPQLPDSPHPDSPPSPDTTEPPDTTESPDESPDTTEPSESSEVTPAPEPQACEPETLRRGEFVTEDSVPSAPSDLPPGHTDPAMASPHELVFVDGTGMPSLVGCVVPSDFAVPDPTGSSAPVSEPAATNSPG